MVEKRRRERGSVGGNLHVLCNVTSKVVDIIYHVLFTHYLFL